MTQECEQGEKMWISAFLIGVSLSSAQSIKCTKGDKSLTPFFPPCSCVRELVRIHLVIHERNLHLPRLSKEEDVLAHVTGKSKGGPRFSHNCMPETLHLCQASFFLPLLLSSSLRELHSEALFHMLRKMTVHSNTPASLGL